MLCSVCKKEQAAIFINEPTAKDPKHVTGYCIKCAKEKGINPLNSVLDNNNIDLGNVAEQLETMFNNISNNMELSDIDFEEASRKRSAYSEPLLEIFLVAIILAQKIKI